MFVYLRHYGFVPPRPFAFIPQTIYAGENQEICLFVKDPETKWNEKLLEKDKVGNLTEVTLIFNCMNSEPSENTF